MHFHIYALSLGTKVNFFVTIAAHFTAWRLTSLLLRLSLEKISIKGKENKKYGTACGYHARALVCKSYFLELLISPQTGRIEQPCNGRRAISFPDPQGVSPGVSPLTKKPEHSGNEIGRRNSSPEINEPQKQQNIP